MKSMVKMFFIKIATTTFILSNTCFVYGQKNNTITELSNIYTLYSTKKEKILLQIIEEENVIDEKSTFIIPIIKLDYQKGYIANLNFTQRVLIVDTLSQTIFEFNTDNVFSKGSSRLSKIANPIPLLTLFNDTKKISTNPLQFFLFYFFDIDQHQRTSLLALESNNKITYSHNTIINTPNLNEILIEMFGSIENYFAYKQNLSDYNNAKQEAVIKFKDFSLVDNWQFYVKYNKTDTLRNLSLLLKEIKLSTAVSKQSLRNIETSIMLILKDTSSFKINFNKELYRDIRYQTARFVSFMNKDISSLLQKHLGKDLYQQYTMQLKIGEKLSSLMEGSLSTRFKGNWNDIRNFIKAKTEIISREPFSYTIKNELRNPNIRISLN